MRGACMECGTRLVYDTVVREVEVPTDAHFGPAYITLSETLPYWWCPECNPAPEPAKTEPFREEPQGDLERAIWKARGGPPPVKRRTI